MSDSYTASLRLDQPQVNASNNTWGGTLNTDLTLIDNAITGIASVNIGGLTAYTMTANNGAADQARCALYQFTGALTANCTVTLPSCVKLGFVQNTTTGGYSVILTTGSGTAATFVSTSSVVAFFICDGTNVTTPSLSATVSPGSTITSVTLNGSTTLEGTVTAIASVVLDNILQTFNAIYMYNLPTSSSGLPPGQLWRSGNNLMIV